MTTAPALSPRVRGKTVRLAWTEGPTKGATHEHVFHRDGTVEWHSVGADGKAQPGANEPERVKYSSDDITDDVCMVSYLASSGYTLTVVLRFDDGSVTGVASNAESWFPVKGRFEIAD
jgi:hypothetical protein